MASIISLRFLKLDQLDPKARRVIMLPLALMIFGILGLAGAVFGYIFSPTWQMIIIVFSNLVALGFYILGYSQIRRGRVELGGWLNLFALTANVASLGVMFQGLGVFLSIVIISLSLLLIL